MRGIAAGTVQSLPYALRRAVAGSESTYSSDHMCVSWVDVLPE
jgi:hypothetical protein